MIFNFPFSAVKRVENLESLQIYEGNFQFKSPERTTVPRQAVKCEARNPCNKDYKTIRVPKVRQKISRQKQKGRRFFIDVLIILNSN